MERGIHTEDLRRLPRDILLSCVSNAGDDSDADGDGLIVFCDAEAAEIIHWCGSIPFTMLRLHSETESADQTLRRMQQDGAISPRNRAVIFIGGFISDSEEAVITVLEAIKWRNVRVFSTLPPQMHARTYTSFSPFSFEGIEQRWSKIASADVRVSTCQLSMAAIDWDTFMLPGTQNETMMCLQASMSRSTDWDTTNHRLKLDTVAYRLSEAVMRLEEASNGVSLYSIGASGSALAKRMRHRVPPSSVSSVKEKQAGVALVMVDRLLDLSVLLHTDNLVDQIHDRFNPLTRESNDVSIPIISWAPSSSSTSSSSSPVGQFGSPMNASTAVASGCMAHDILGDVIRARNFKVALGTLRDHVYKVCVESGITPERVPKRGPANITHLKRCLTALASSNRTFYSASDIVDLCSAAIAVSEGEGECECGYDELMALEKVLLLSLVESEPESESAMSSEGEGLSAERLNEITLAMSNAELDATHTLCVAAGVCSAAGASALGFGRALPTTHSLPTTTLQLLDAIACARDTMRMTSPLKTPSRSASAEPLIVRLIKLISSQSQALTQSSSSSGALTTPTPENPNDLVYHAGSGSGASASASASASTSANTSSSGDGKDKGRAGGGLGSVFTRGLTAGLNLIKSFTGSPCVGAHSTVILFVVGGIGVSELNAAAAIQSQLELHSRMRVIIGGSHLLRRNDVVNHLFLCNM